MLIKKTLLILLLLSANVYAIDNPKNEMDLKPEERAYYRNPDGSCVQCSIGMCGMYLNIPEAYTLLWDSPYGPKVRGGSGPGRVSGYCNSRGIKAYNVTGSNTWDWMKWACKTGRFAAIGAGGNHFQTLYGYDPKINKYFVCNNNSTHKIDEYDEAGFRRLHLASGQWVVVLRESVPDKPKYVDWWKRKSK